MSELLSIALFVASVMIYALKAGRNTWWFAATLTVLGLFVILNITLYASNYFTGDGINDAVLYTLTNSLTGAGVGKYILPGVGIALALTTVFVALGWILRRRRHHPHHVGYSLLALLLALASVDASPAFHQITELVKSGLSLVICARPTNSSPLSPEACSINCLTVCTSGLNSYSPGRQTAPEMIIRLS